MVRRLSLGGFRLSSVLEALGCDVCTLADWRRERETISVSLCLFPNQKTLVPLVPDSSGSCDHASIQTYGLAFRPERACCRIQADRV